MKIYPESKKEGKLNKEGLTPTQVLMRKIAILMVFATCYFFFIKLLFL